MRVLSIKAFRDIISWTPSGNAFQIHSAKRFVAEVLPEHFKTAKYSSFTRKLQRWGFVRQFRGEDAGAYLHPAFQKGRLDLAEQMTSHKSGESLGPTTALAASDPTVAVAAPVATSVPAMRSPAPFLSLPGLTALPPTIPVPSLPGSSLPGLGVPPSLALATNPISTAIELEVARCVQERILAAQRLALEQQIMQERLLGRVQEHLMIQRRESLLMDQLRHSQRLHVQLLREDHKEEEKQASPDSQPLQGLPRTNIFSAKSA